MTSSTGPDIHFTALCNAIEHEKLEKTKAILETHPSLHLDSANNDGFTPLDLAFMTGNQDILRFLINHRPETGKKVFILLTKLDLRSINWENIISNNEFFFNRRQQKISYM